MDLVERLELQGSSSDYFVDIETNVFLDNAGMEKRGGRTIN